MRTVAPPLRLSPGKRWLFRAAAVLLGLLPFALAEAALRATGYGQASEATDPYLGFTSIRPLFMRQGQQYVTDPARLAYFRPETFAAEKPRGEYRIFCLGGSTVQGRPYAIETAFSSWLELSLQAAEPDRTWQVVNCGGVSYASYRLVPILREVLEYEADLIILYTGHNEFLEDRTYREVKETPDWVARLHTHCTRFRVYNVCRRWLVRDARAEQPPPSAVLPTEVDALLDYRGGLADYHRDDAWRAGAVEHFAFNLRRMIHICREAGVDVLLVNPVSNLRDCAPFKSANCQDLTARQLELFESLWEEARLSESPPAQRALLEEAVAIDPRHAAAQYALAKCLETLGHYDDAKEAYVRAKEEDICPLRMIEPLHQALFAVARQTGTPVVDVRALIESLSRHGIPGEDWMLDHVHPSINGHQQIAEALLTQLADQGIVQPRPDWTSAQQQLYAAHLHSLPAAYYVHGQQRLHGLRTWTQGLAPKLRQPD